MAGATDSLASRTQTWTASLKGLAASTSKSSTVSRIYIYTYILLYADNAWQYSKKWESSGSKKVSACPSSRTLQPSRSDAWRQLSGSKDSSISNHICKDLTQKEHIIFPTEWCKLTGKSKKSNQEDVFFNFFGFETKENRNLCFCLVVVAGQNPKIPLLLGHDLLCLIVQDGPSTWQTLKRTR